MTAQIRGALALLLAVLLGGLLSPVRAAGLEPLRIEAYLETLAAVRALGERMQAAGQGALLIREITPRPGQAFDPHRRAVRALAREHPARLAELNALVQQRGFTSADSWARVGDRVVLAYGAVKATAESPELLLLAQQLQGLDPQLLQALPPQEQAELQLALVIAQALAQVPEADRRQIQPYIGRLDRLLAPGAGARAPDR